ncbi:MAG: DUF4932 domain-containing protein [Candidatus Krumholzibacteriia bacterium]
MRSSDRFRLIFIILITIMTAAGRPLPARALAGRVDPGVELVSIIFRLAGSPEYLDAPDSPYTRAVDAHFGALADHAAVQRAKELRALAGISYDAAAEIALYLDADRDFAPSMPLDPRPGSLDERWVGPTAADFAVLAGEFARDGDFAGFRRGWEEFYAEAASRLDEVPGGNDLESWITSCYGPHDRTEFIPVVGLLTGRHSYGLRVDLPEGRSRVHAIQGVWAVDEDGLPRFPGDTAATLVHEFSHSFVNPVVNRNLEALKAAGERIMPRVAGVMRDQAYGTWETVVCESCVRAATVRFLAETQGEQAARDAVAREKAHGFQWMPGLADLFRGPDGPDGAEGAFASFFPRVVAFLDDHAAGLPAGPAPVPLGSINTALNALLTGGGVVVGPGPEAGPGGTAAAAYVQAVHGKFFAPRGIALVVETDPRDPVLADAGGMILYGTPESSPMMASLFSAWGIALDAGGVDLCGRRVEASPPLLIAALPDPGSESRIVIVYAASSLELLPGINNLYHGPTGWVVGWGGGQGKPQAADSGGFELHGGILKVSP